MSDSALPNGTPDDVRFSKHTVILRFDDGSGASAEITFEEAATVLRELGATFGDRLVDLPMDTSDVDPAECRASGRHPASPDSTGECLECGTI